MEYLFETGVGQLLCRQAITSVIEKMGEVPSELLKALLLAWEYLTCRIWTTVPEECSYTCPIFFILRTLLPVICGFLNLAFRCWMQILS